MTIEEVKKEFGFDADTMCGRFCELCKQMIGIASAIVRRLHG